MIFLHYINHILIDMENKNLIENPLYIDYQYLKIEKNSAWGDGQSLAPEREEGKVLNKNTPQRIYIISI